MRHLQERMLSLNTKIPASRQSRNFSFVNENVPMDVANPGADSVHADDASKRTSIDVSSHPALVWSVINKIKSLDKFYFYLFLFNTYPQRVKGWQKYPADFYRETSERKFCRRFSHVFQ